MKTLTFYLLSLSISFHSNAQQIKQIVENISGDFINYSKAHSAPTIVIDPFKPG